MKCDYCDHEWISVSPVEAQELECPECGRMSSVEVSPPRPLPARVAYWQHQYKESQRRRIRIMCENRVRGGCLEIAMKALRWYGHNCPVLLCGKAGEALDKIEQRLAQLEPEEGR